MTLTAMLLVLSSWLISGPPDAMQAPAADVEGLWAYTELAPRGQKGMPLTGMFVFRDGLFVQQTINDGEPFEAQVGQGHCGTYRPKDGIVELTAEVQIALSPRRTPPLSLRHGVTHQITPELSGDSLTLTFGTGTIQKFKKIGPAKGRIYRLEGGMLALVDGHFLLVAAASDQDVVGGSGTFVKDGGTLILQAQRWYSATADGASNKRDTKIEATFDEQVLKLPGGPAMKVVR